MITSTRKLKIWTIITHALIIVGFGHGILFFCLIEVIGFPYITKDKISFLFDAPFESRLPVIGLTILLGQCGLIFSIVHKQSTVKLAFHIIGLALLWLSIAYYVYGLSEDGYVYFAYITTLPFLYCTLYFFIARPVKRQYEKFMDYI